ncbi:MAG: hypothetical protein QM715_11420 [Nibricoccus sp.]
MIKKTGISKRQIYKSPKNSQRPGGWTTAADACSATFGDLKMVGDLARAKQMERFEAKGCCNCKSRFASDGLNPLNLLQ